LNSTVGQVPGKLPQADRLAMVMLLATAMWLVLASPKLVDARN